MCKLWNQMLGKPGGAPAFHFCGDQNCRVQAKNRPTYHVMRWRVAELEDGLVDAVRLPLIFPGKPRKCWPGHVCQNSLLRHE